MSIVKETPPPTEHAVQQYVPPPKPARQGMALCLSGGGYRALLFHLGAARRLNELGILAGMRTIASVSGGSLLNAKFAGARLGDGPLSASDWTDRVAGPLER